MGTPGESATSRDEARALVADFEAARGKRLTSAERQRLDAAAIYAIAYTARCEHSGDPAGARADQGMRAVLRSAPLAGYCD